MLLTRHAVRQARPRGLSTVALSLVLRYAGSCHTRRAEIHFGGRRESNGHRNVPRLASVEGVHVVCSTDNCPVITAYPNHKAPRAGRARFRPACSLSSPREEARS